MRWLLLIWVFLTWIATLILGWHYAIDGIGGIAVAVTSVLAARWVLSFNNVS
jgi:membrane-associated phospholipid phosphatase